MAKTVKQLSEELGISTATVSRALNGGTVAPETLKRVLDAVGEDRPRTRRSSAEVRGGGTAMVIAAKLNNPITLGYIEGLRRRLGEMNIRTVITLTDYRSETECDALSYAEANGCAGIFMLNSIENPHLLRLLAAVRKRTPVVLVNRYLRGLDTDVVTIDNYRCGYLAGEYLIRHRHRRIGHIAGPGTSITCHNRTQGFLDAVRDAGLGERTTDVYYGDRTWHAGAEYARRLLSLPRGERPTAVFSATGLMAAGMVDTLRKEAVRVPEDISVIINDDYSKDYMPYPIDFTCFGQDPTLMGAAAADLMAERLRCPDGAPRRVVLAPVLTEYSSVLLPREE